MRVAPRAPVINMDTAAIMEEPGSGHQRGTAIAHLAGALGAPVWVALSTIPDWRWLLEREDSPWYPRMRLFRQKERGHWEEVFNQMAESLRQIVARPQRAER